MFWQINKVTCWKTNKEYSHFPKTVNKLLVLIYRSKEQFNFVSARQSGPHVFCTTKASNLHKTFFSPKNSKFLVFCLDQDGFGWARQFQQYNYLLVTRKQLRKQRWRFLYIPNNIPSSFAFDWKITTNRKNNNFSIKIHN